MKKNFAIITHRKDGEEVTTAGDVEIYRDYIVVQLRNENGVFISKTIYNNKIIDIDYQED